MADKKLKNSRINKSTIDYYMQGASLDDPPKVFEQGKPNWKKRHDEVLSYARLLFQNIASEETLWQAQQNASTYDAFYTGSESPQPTEFEISMISANMINAAINLKEATLLNHRLEMHYVSDKNQDYDLTVAVQRLFDWQALRTQREYFKSIVELSSIIQGTSGLLLLPKDVYKGNRKIRVPAYPEHIDLRKCYFDPYEDQNDFTCFIIRDVIKGHLADQEYREILKARDLDRFPRGSGFSIWAMGDKDDYIYMNPQSSRSVYSESRGDYLTQMSGDDVEMVRIWKRDYRTIKAKLYKPFIDPQTKNIDSESDNEETQYARWVAEKELMPVIMTGLMAQAGENHYNHLLVHKIDLEQMKSDKKLPDTEVDDAQIGFMESHIDLHEKFLDDGDQPADEIINIPMFDGQWRVIKIIGDQIIADGSSVLEYEKFPVVLFRNAIDPNTSLGISDVSQLANLNAAMNSLMCDLLMNSHDNAFPDKRLPMRMKNPEEFPEGEYLYVDPEEDADWMFQPIAAGQFPQQAFSAIGMFRNMIEVVSGGNATMRGEPGQVRSSGVETQTKLMAAQQRFMSSEVLFGQAWERFAEITLGQICQFMKNETIMPIVGPEYQDIAPVIVNAIDPYATIKVMRVPKDTDFENQNGQIMHQFAMMFLEAGMVTPQTVMRVLSSEGSSGTVGRIYGKFWAEMQKPEVQEEMAQLKQMQTEQAASKGK